MDGGPPVSPHHTLTLSRNMYISLFSIQIMDRREILYMYLPAGVVEWLATNNLENRCECILLEPIQFWMSNLCVYIVRVVFSNTGYYLIRQSAIIRWRILRRCEQGLNPYPPFIMREIVSWSWNITSLQWNGCWSPAEVTGKTLESTNSRWSQQCYCHVMLTCPLTWGGVYP